MQIALRSALALTLLEGVVSFMVDIGTRVLQGQPLFQVCDPVSDKITTVRSPADGCMYNRERLRFAQPGLWICKVMCILWHVTPQSSTDA
jgi:predicted deacylase